VSEFPFDPDIKFIPNKHWGYDHIPAIVAKPRKTNQIVPDVRATPAQ
jgi:hypothetical protein